jgi:hypothetical protein
MRILMHRLSIPITARRRTRLATPVSVTPLTSVFPNTFAFLASGRDLYAADSSGGVASEVRLCVSAAA